MLTKYKCRKWLRNSYKKNINCSKRKSKVLDTKNQQRTHLLSQKRKNMKKKQERHHLLSRNKVVQTVLFSLSESKFSKKKRQTGNLCQPRSMTAKRSFLPLKMKLKPKTVSWKPLKANQYKVSQEINMPVKETSKKNVGSKKITLLCEVKKFC